MEAARAKVNHKPPSYSNESEKEHAGTTHPCTFLKLAIDGSASVDIEHDWQLKEEITQHLKF